MLTQISIVKATLTTDHFDFEAYGATKVEAERALKGALRKHGGDYELAPDWYVYYIEDADYHILQVGCAYRDGEIIYER